MREKRTGEVRTSDRSETTEDGSRKLQHAVRILALPSGSTDCC
jgi:hypothetical protein